MRERLVEVRADQVGLVGIGGERHGCACAHEGTQEVEVGVELGDGLPETAGGDLDGESGRRSRESGPLVQLGQQDRVGAPAEDLREIGMREHVHGLRDRQLAERVDVALPALVDRHHLPHARRHVDGHPVQPVHRAEQVVEGIRLEQLGQARLLLADVVDLEAELHRQPLPLCLEHRIAVVVQVVDAALRQVGDLPRARRSDGSSRRAL